MEKLEEEICKNKMLEKEIVIKNNINTMYAARKSKQVLKSELQPQITGNSHMCRDHLLCSTQIDPVKVMAAMYTRDNE